MKNIQTVEGKLEIIEQLKHSKNGNPKFLLKVGEVEMETETDSGLTFLVKSYQGKTVTAKYGLHRNKVTLSELDGNTV